VTEGALDGIRVIEIGTSVAAPFAAQILSGMGADVVKVEAPGRGDDARLWGPPFVASESVAFMSLNRGKRGLALDFKSADGSEVMTRLIASSDVLLQNLRPGSVAAAGFGYERCAEINPRLIYCDMSGFGSVGPKAKDPAYDPLLQAFSGIADMTGEAGGAPVRVPVSLLDMGTGMWTAIGVLQAVLLRERTGVGSHIETSLLETAFGWTSSVVAGALAGQPAPPKLGSGFLSVVPYGAFACSDKYIFVAVGNNTLWERLCACLEAPELLGDERFKSNPDRVRNRAETNAAVETATREFTAAALLARLREARIPCSPVNSVTDAIREEQVQALGVIEQMNHPRIPGYQAVNLPVRTNGGYPSMDRVAPLLGEHSAQLLSELGYDEEAISKLISASVIEQTTAAAISAD
jgi:crotonobetainyl-CoA:carnitine CoA-transferase CaiB-like acyl-CoA transferase